MKEQGGEARRSTPDIQRLNWFAAVFQVLMNWFAAVNSFSIMNWFAVVNSFSIMNWFAALNSSSIMNWLFFFRF